MSLIVEGNRYISKNEPWKLPKTGRKEDIERLNTIIYIALEQMRIVSLLLLPIMPGTMAAVLDRLGVPQEERNFNHVKFGRTPGVKLGSNANFKAFQIPDIK